MKTDTTLRNRIRRARIFLGTVPLLAVPGCIGENPEQMLGALLEDLARQLLTFWIL